MSTSVGTKAKKKQSSLLKREAPVHAAPGTADPRGVSSGSPGKAPDRDLEKAMLALETSCLMVLESEFSPPAGDADAAAARQRFINVATPVSLALMECKGGPRHFHHHYRHSRENSDVLQPVMENPVDNLALACREAQKHCHEELLGLRDPELRRTRQAFRRALSGFLALHEKG